jgi:hypothetical protein
VPFLGLALPRAVLEKLFILDKTTKSYCFRIEYPASAVGAKIAINTTLSSHLVRYGEDFSDRLVILNVTVF